MWKLSAAVVLLSCGFTAFGNRFKLPQPLRNAPTIHAQANSCKSTKVTTPQKVLFNQQRASAAQKDERIKAYILVTHPHDEKFEDNFARLRDAIDRGVADLNARDQDGNTALASAIRQFNIHMFHEILPETTDLGIMGHEHFFDRLKQDIIKNSLRNDEFQLPAYGDYEEELQEDDYHLEDKLAILAHMKFEYIKRKDCRFD